MKISINDLRVGDEIIVPSQSKLKYVKVLGQPIPDGRLHWRKQTPLFKSVRCSIASIQTPTPVTSWRKKPGVSNDYQFEPDSTKHNARISLNLNYVDIWLVNRQNP